MSFAIPDSDFGRRVERRLREDVVAWLTTVRRDGLPQPSPVWFLWDGSGELLIYSRPGTQKLRNLARGPLVSVHLDGDGRGGDIVVVSGAARIAEDAPPADSLPEYVEKYAPGFARIGMTARQFAQSYSVGIRVRATGLRGH
jgi:PPOX class probable F420-dependent enzyme